MARRKYPYRRRPALARPLHWRCGAWGACPATIARVAWWTRRCTRSSPNTSPRSSPTPRLMTAPSHVLCARSSRSSSRAASFGAWLRLGSMRHLLLPAPRPVFLWRTRLVSELHGPPHGRHRRPAHRLRRAPSAGATLGPLAPPCAALPARLRRRAVWRSARCLHPRGLRLGCRRQPATTSDSPRSTSSTPQR